MDTPLLKFKSMSNTGFWRISCVPALLFGADEMREKTVQFDGVEIKKWDKMRKERDFWHDSWWHLDCSLILLHRHSDRSCSFLLSFLFLSTITCKSMVQTHFPFESFTDTHGTVRLDLTATVAYYLITGGLSFKLFVRRAWPLVPGIRSGDL